MGIGTFTDCEETVWGCLSYKWVGFLICIDEKRTAKNTFSVIVDHFSTFVADYAPLPDDAYKMTTTLFSIHIRQKLEKLDMGFMP